MTTALHVHSGNLFGGIERMLVTLAAGRHLHPALRHEYAICADGALRRGLLDAGVEPALLGTVRARHPLRVFAARRAVRDLLAERAIDIAICHSPWALSIFGPAARVAGVPVAVWLHGDVSSAHWIDRWAARARPDLIICNSRFTASTAGRFDAGIPRAIVYCPVAQPGAFSASDCAAARAELQTPADAIVIAHVGRMEEGKGHPEHLRALSRLTANDRWICWMIGGVQRPREREHVAQLRRLAGELGIAGRVRFAGERADVGRLLAAADIYCQPNSRPEGFGIALVEALLARLPVVTTALGGALEVIGRDAALLVDPADAGGQPLADAIARLLADDGLRRALGDAGHDRARRLTDVPTQLQHLDAVLSEAISTHSRRSRHIA